MLPGYLGLPKTYMACIQVYYGDEKWSFKAYLVVCAFEHLNYHLLSTIITATHTITAHIIHEKVSTNYSYNLSKLKDRKISTKKRLVKIIHDPQ